MVTEELRSIVREYYMIRAMYLILQCPGTDNPSGIRTWTDSQLRVASQRSNQLGQRVRPAGEKLAGRLDCHIPPRHPYLATRHSHQGREKHDNQSALSELSMTWALPRPADEPPM